MAIQNKISIGEVLAEIKLPTSGTNANIFQISYWKDDGTLKTIDKATRHVKNSAIGGTGTEKSNFKYNLNEKEAILLYDTEKKQYRSCLIYRIHTFNNLKVHH